MGKNRELIHLRNENRGLKKKIKHVADASRNNHNGMLHWKNKFLEEQIARHFRHF